MGALEILFLSNYIIESLIIGINQMKILILVAIDIFM